MRQKTLKGTSYYHILIAVDLKAFEKVFIVINNKFTAGQEPAL